MNSFCRTGNLTLLRGISPDAYRRIIPTDSEGTWCPCWHICDVFLSKTGKVKFASAAFGKDVTGDWQLLGLQV